MTNDELRSALAEMGLGQSELARLIGVTSRAVSLWLSGDRAIPGPAEAYIRLFRVLPPGLRQIELNRLKERGTPMRDGMYGISFQGRQSAGMGVLIFDAGRAYGTDSQGVKFDGEYVFNEKTARA